MTEKLHTLPAHELGRMIKSKQVSSREVTESFVERITAVDESVKSFVTTTFDTAFSQADAVDEAIARGEDLGPLAGVPCALKDNLNTRGIRTTCSSKILHNYKPVYDATVVNRLAAAGVVALGKTNLDEFAMGSSTENSGFFVTHNPWNLSLIHI